VSDDPAGYYREKADHCRRLASSIVNRRAEAALLKLAQEFDERAAKIESLARMTVDKSD
jgi:hypothetical protein